MPTQSTARLRYGWLRYSCLLFLFVSLNAVSSAQGKAKRPNILWLLAEDTSPWMGCYGDPINKGQTPHIDSLAERGVRFSRAYAPAPVCSPCRSALMAGMNQIRFGAHEHRSSRGPVKIELPDGVKLLPQLIKESGYFTFNLGKDDYNFEWDQAATYSWQNKRRGEIDWQKIKSNQPFFGQIQTAGGKNNTTKFPASRKVDPQDVTVPADYPQNDLYRETVAQHYDAIRKDDDYIGEVLDGLKRNGLAENTIVVYVSDHGANNLVRHKQMVTEGGLHVPLVIAGPSPHVPAPSVRDDLVNLLDLSATTLAWANVKQPSWFEGQDLFGEILVPRVYVAAAKDRMDHTIDRVRSLRTDRFRYTRNFKTDRILLQPQYRDGRPFLQNLHDLYRSGELSPTLTKIYFGERPEEEFYDVVVDPAQVNNLVKDPEFREQLKRHRQLLADWIAQGDAGIDEEPLGELAFQASGQKWGEGVNPEYELVRKDSDGDGLSDEWERINGREGSDGKLLFTFDCGGWQTEGWEASDVSMGNIAGQLGTLEFNLPNGKGAIVRRGLELDRQANHGDLVIELQCPQGTQLTLITRSGKSQTKQSTTVQSSEMAAVQFPVDWKATVDQLELVFQSEKDAVIKMDSIQVRPAE
ncbi:sulfatase [Stieleria sp. JC731]|uniref:sulfatase family protein n=1 Tax=Pirellulaceae TaxID=2691357 RepID=UPI001E557A2E|nr:sulfatase [Stieleria sp. JC731]MCC9600657.1 sulfatase [Stieleria sp. JC731]